MGTQLPHRQKRGGAHNFRHMSIVANGWMHQDATWYGGRPRLRRNMLYGDSAPAKKGYSTPIFGTSIFAKRLYVSGYHLVRNYEVRLSLGGIVLDGDPALPPRKGNRSQFSANVWPNGWMDEDATWYGCRPPPRPQAPQRLCVRCGLSSYRQKKGHTYFPPNFWPMSIVAKRLDGSRYHLVHR